MKHNFTFIILWLVSSLFNGAYSQMTLSVLPDTPLEYFVFEATTPKIRDGYNTRENYLSTYLLAKTTARKYSDLPLYDHYSETVDFISTLDVRTQINRTSTYISYVVEARENLSDPFIVYAKDTFFLNGTVITSISETIYDYPDTSYATYTVTYHSNGKIDEVKFENGSGYDVRFGGLKVVYNDNNTIQSDTIYQRNYDGETGDWNKVEIMEYTEKYYNSGNPLKIDSAYFYSENTVPKHNERHYFTSNANNEITEIKFYNYDSGSGTFKIANTFKFGVDVDLITTTNSAVSMAEVSVYPNPSQDKIYINNEIFSADYYIYDAKGTLINKGEYNGMNGIPVSSLETGQYVIRLKDRDKEWLGKFIK